ncbi:unnamed protein product [Closterium sp. Naga37s-1]|nr:unnamed protein product [Closterium sp. Naga37s-1]
MREQAFSTCRESVYQGNSATPLDHHEARRSQSQSQQPVSARKTATPGMSAAPGHAHTRVTTGEEGEELDPMVEQLQDCSRLYVRLENCLVEHDRDWRKCQEARVFLLSLPVCSQRFVP